MNWRGWVIGLAGFGMVSPAGTTGEPGLHFSVLINEFLADPDPSAGLPSYPFVEIKNVSPLPCSLEGWSIGNGKTSALLREDIVLQPDSLLVLCPVSGAEAYSHYGASTGLKSFPAFSHVSGQIILKGPGDEVIDAVAYDRESFNDPVKAEGGWSLERIDARKPCLGRINWTASTEPSGGSPGRENAVSGTTENIGDTAESVSGFTRSICPDSMHIVLLLDGPLDQTDATDPAQYRINPAAPAVWQAELLPPFFDQVSLSLDKALQEKQVYSISISGLHSCGLPVSDATLRSGLAAVPDSGDLRFNEILFNPPPYGTDYLEIYHGGKSIIDLQHLQLASRDANGKLKDPRPVTDVQWLLFPEDYLVLTEDRNWVLTHYLVKTPAQLLTVSQLPSMPDDQGDVVLINDKGVTIDELPYHHQWHSPLIADESGVALEKTGTGLASASAGNWTSAASTAGFGTPTYLNSETSRPASDSSRSVVTTEPTVFSPDNDGYNDFCFVRVRAGRPGFTANISIYNRSGVNVRSLVSGASMGTDAGFRWDGAGDTGNPLASGPYVVFTQIFSVDGTVRQYKNVIVLARNR